MNVVSYDLLQSSIIQADATVVNKTNFGFVEDTCNLIKLMFSHICIHAVENVDILTNNRKIALTKIINSLK